MSWRCSCGAFNKARAKECEDCGGARPQGATAKPSKKLAGCPADGSPLRATDGWCDLGRGYAMARAFSPFACPVCRHPLAWSGRCFTCFGAVATTDRDSWTIPGDRYELEDGHWRLVEKGPQRVCTREENQRAIAVVGAVYRGELGAAEGHEMLALLLTARSEVER